MAKPFGQAGLDIIADPPYGGRSIYSGISRYCLSCQGLIVRVEGRTFDQHGPDDVEQLSHAGG
jgi:hypothetical protein